MYWTTALILSLFCADSRSAVTVDPPEKLKLVLTPNASSILQRDNLLVRVMLEVPLGSAVTAIVEPPHELNAYHFRVEVREGDKWRRIRNVVEESIGQGCMGSYRRTFPAATRYAEYNWFHQDHGAYIFDRPGKHELRAVAKLSTGELQSDSVTITVAERPEGDLLRIKDGRIPSHFSIGHLRWTGPDDSDSYASLGGNVKATIQHFQMLREYLRTGKVLGQEVGKKDVCATLQQKMDPISWEYSLTLLGKHYVSLQDIEGLTSVVEATPAFESSDFRFAAQHLASFLQRQEQIERDKSISPRMPDSQAENAAQRE